MDIKVLLADDHQLLVAGFRQVLGGRGVDVVGVAHSLVNLYELYVSLKPDVLVIDIRFDKLAASDNGLDFCQRLLGKDPKAKIVIFSQFDDQYIIEKSYKLGVLAFVRKDESVDVLQESIKSAAEGIPYFSPVIARTLALSTIKETNPKRILDFNELKAFILTADGVHQNQIAKELNVSIKTVSTIMSRVKMKLAMENSADMTKLAIQFGLTTTTLKKKN
jgi:two-component system invasion response regulator UvrY